MTENPFGFRNGTSYDASIVPAARRRTTSVPEAHSGNDKSPSVEPNQVYARSSGERTETATMASEDDNNNTQKNVDAYFGVGGGKGIDDEDGSVIADPIAYDGQMTKKDIDHITTLLFPKVKFIDRDFKRNSRSDIAKFCYNHAGYTKLKTKKTIDEWWPDNVPKIEAKLRNKRGNITTRIGTTFKGECD